MFGYKSYAFNGGLSRPFSTNFLSLLIILVFLCMSAATGQATQAEKKVISPAVLTYAVTLEQETTIRGIDMEITGYDTDLLEITDISLTGGILQDSGYVLLDNISVQGQLSLAIYAEGTLVTGQGDVVFITLAIEGDEGNAALLSLAKSECNDLPVSGGFLIDDAVFQSIRISVNNSPTAQEITLNTDEDSSLSGELTATDADEDSLIYSIIREPEKGSVEITDPDTGDFVYTPDADENGVDTFTYQVSDGLSESNIAAVTVEIIAVNDAPVFAKGTDVTVNEDAVPQTVTNWATEISPGPADESGQSLIFEVSLDSEALFSQGPAIDALGNLTFTPETDANGSAEITVTLKDDGGTENNGANASPPQTFIITVNAVNDAPGFIKGPDVIVNEDADIQILTDWATEIFTGPADESGQSINFEISTDNETLFSQGPAIDALGSLSFTSASHANGSATITVTLRDNGGTENDGMDASPEQSFFITVSGINDMPSFTKGPDVIVNEDAGPQTVTYWATEVSPGPAEESAQSLTFNVSTDNENLFSEEPVVDALGSLIYTPAPDANGIANIFVILKDNGGVENGGADTSQVQTFVITVNKVNTTHPDLSKALTRPWMKTLALRPSRTG